MAADLQVLHIPGYDNLQNAYARQGTREEIQTALAALGEPRPMAWRRGPAVPIPLSSIPPRFMAVELADAVESLRTLYDYKARGDGRKVASEIRRGGAWLTVRGWTYHAESRQLRCLTCRRAYSRSAVGNDTCPRQAA
jgi:hypothetical protein